MAAAVPRDIGKPREPSVMAAVTQPGLPLTAKLAWTVRAGLADSPPPGGIPAISRWHACDLAPSTATAMKPSVKSADL